jgi:hypothetical protein
MLNTRILFAVAALSVLAPAAHADLVFSTTPTSALPGGTGTFEILLTDTDGAGSSAYDVGLVNFDLKADSTSGIQFTAADTNTTTPYIFYGNSGDITNGFPLSSDSFPTTEVDGGDNTIGSPTTMNPGDVYGLANITYTVSPGAALGPAALTFEDVGGGTVAEQSDETALPSAAMNSTITVGPANAAVPEASSLALLSLALLPLGLLAAKRHRKHAA